MVQFAKKYNFSVRVVRYDAGSVENSAEVDVFLRLHSIERRAALPENQNQILRKDQFGISRRLSQLIWLISPH